MLGDGWHPGPVLFTNAPAQGSSKRTVRNSNCFSVLMINLILIIITPMLEHQ